MANCKDVALFLSGIQTRQITSPPAPADLASLEQSNLIRLLSADQAAQLSQEVTTLGSARNAIVQEGSQRAQIAARVRQDTEKTHSLLFHLEGAQKRATLLQQQAQDQAALQSTDSDLSAKEKQFADLLTKKAILDSLCPFDGRFVGLTGLGTIALRDLGVRMYRVSDVDFGTYWGQSQQMETELRTLTAQSASYVGAFPGSFGSFSRASLWAVAIGMAKQGGDPNQRLTNFVNTFAQLGPLSGNEENRLMSAEIVSTLDQPVQYNLNSLAQLLPVVRNLGVPRESSLGVASILLLGQRADGTFATPALAQFLRMTPSFETAALLSVIYRPFDEVASKFMALRSMFNGWGYAPSEDVELSSAYLTISEIPPEGVSTKLVILSRGLATYLVYPLVASSILASIPVLEAHETLNVLEHGYDLLGQRTGPMSQAELICLAVRLIHGIKSESIGTLDTTAASSPAGFMYAPSQRLLFMPLMVGHQFYFSTFSGIGGVHPGHVHVAGGGFVG